MSSIKPNLNQTTNRTTQANSDEFDLGYMLAVCFDNKWIIVTATVLVTLIGISYAWLATPKFRADALLQVENTQSNLGLELMVLGQESAGASSTQSEILRSRMIMGQAASQAGLDLVVEPNYFPFVGGAFVRRGIVRPNWDQDSSHAWYGDNLYVGELN